MIIRICIHTQKSSVESKNAVNVISAVRARTRSGKTYGLPTILQGSIYKQAETTPTSTRHYKLPLFHFPFPNVAHTHTAHIQQAHTHTHGTHTHMAHTHMAHTHTTANTHTHTLHTYTHTHTHTHGTHTQHTQHTHARTIHTHTAFLQENQVTFLAQGHPSLNPLPLPLPHFLLSSIRSAAVQTETNLDGLKAQQKLLCQH